MTSATFETATLADAVVKAARHAPTKGSALDRSAGIMLTVAAEGCEVRSTDLSVFYRQLLRPVSLRGDDVIWRAPSRLFSDILRQLPMHMGSTTTLADKGDGNLYLKCEGVKAKIRLISSTMDFPRWEPFEITDMGVVEHLADRLAQVGWCTEKKGSDMLTGVHLDGHHLFATNRKEAVRVPLSCPVERPVTAPLQEVQALVKDHPEVHLRVGRRLELSTDPETQVELMLFEDAYPNVNGLLEIALPHTVSLRKDPLISAIDRLLVIVAGERYPRMKVDFEAEGLIRLTIDAGADVGLLIEEIEAPELVECTFQVTPDSLRNLLGSARQSEVQFFYASDNPRLPFRVADDSGYVGLGLQRTGND